VNAGDETISAEDETHMALVSLSGSNYAPLMGILGGGYYFHNISLPVIRNAA